MYRFLLLSLTLLFSDLPFCNAQNDTAHYDANWQTTGKYDTAHFCIYKKDGSNGYTAQCYSLKTGALNMKAHVMSMDSLLKNADATYYYTSGHISTEAHYEQGKETSTTKRYYDTSGILWLEQNHKDNTLTSYYRSGKLKRYEVRDQEGSPKATGKCYDEQGKEIKFTAFEVMPVFKHSMKKYIRKNVTYPAESKKKNIEGRVIVKFTIDKDGSVTDVQIAQHVSPQLDAEAYRVIANMKPWQPGIQDDVAVKVKFTLPITFKLK